MNILQDASAILKASGIDTLELDNRVDFQSGAFESASIIGFILAYSTPSQLLQNWQTDADKLLRSSLTKLEAARDKSWNSYLIVLAVGEPSYGERLTISAIEEDLIGTRKIARAGIFNLEATRLALLPLLPIQSAPRLLAIDMKEEIRVRTSELPETVVTSFLSSASLASLAQLMEEIE